MSKLKLLMTCVLVAALSALVWGSPAFAATTASSHSVYSFDLTSGDTARATAVTVMPGGMTISAGDYMRVSGSGTFDPAAQTVKASGKFIHYNIDSTIHCRGTWKASAFSSFLDFGTNADGQEGGVLSIIVTHYCSTMGMTMSGIPMTVTSTIKAPAGYVAGITVGPFTQPTAGRVVMQPEQ